MAGLKNLGLKWSLLTALTRPRHATSYDRLIFEGLDEFQPRDDAGVLYIHLCRASYGTNRTNIASPSLGRKNDGGLC